MVTPLCKGVWQFLKSLNIELSYALAIRRFLGLHPRQMKTYAYIKTCTHIFIAVVFLIAEMWEQSKSSSTDEWVNKKEHIRTTVYYLSIRGIKNG